MFVSGLPVPSVNFGRWQRGSLALRKGPCIRPNCPACASGEGHSSYAPYGRRGKRRVSAASHYVNVWPGNRRLRSLRFDVTSASASPTSSCVSPPEKREVVQRTVERARAARENRSCLAAFSALVAETLFLAQDPWRQRHPIMVVADRLTATSSIRRETARGR